MQRLIITALVAFALAMLMGPKTIEWLKKLKFGQTVYELEPESNKKKNGTPTMGGMIFAIPALIAAVALAINDTRFDYLLMILVCAFGFGLIGFVDDFIKVKLKRSLGLTPKQKLIPQIVLAIGLSVWAYLNPTIGSKWVIPFVNVEWDLGWVFIPVMVFVLVGTVNSANLLDGLDGLCGGVSLVDFGTFALIAIALASANEANASNLMNVAVFACAMVGALLGFLRFNAHPAKVFMGDVGSFFLGGGIAGIALVTRLSLLLPIIALALFMSSLSDIIQILHFKRTRIKTGTGKRVFRMAPMHYHFVLGGMAETHVVNMYVVTTAVLCLVALLGFVK